LQARHDVSRRKNPDKQPFHLSHPFQVASNHRPKSSHPCQPVKTIPFSRLKTKTSIPFTFDARTALSYYLQDYL
jgi:hypothetical protein